MLETAAVEAAKKKLVVIGNGMAGARTVEEILACGGGAQFEVTVFGDEPYGNYNRILLSSVLNGSQDVSEIFLNGLDWYKDNDVNLRAGVRVDVIARPHKAVHCDDGNWYPYDKLIIATGSRPSIPPIAALKKPNGELRPGVFVFRTLDDCRKIAEYAGKSRRAAVIGGGLLGLEAARGLLNHGVEVNVIHLLNHLMEQQLDPQAGVILKNTIEKMGIQVHLKKLTKSLLGDNEVIGLAFEDGQTLECDMVVIATGITPNTEIGARWGLTTERGIVVDDQLRTSDPDIFAVGECAQHRGRVYGLVAPLWDQAKVLAEHITGANPAAAYEGSKLATKLKVMGVELASMGVIAGDGENEDVVQFMEPQRGVYKKLIIRDGRLAGGILMGEISKAAYLLQAFDRGIKLQEDRLSLLFDTGAPSAKVTFEEMPADVQICNCNGVKKGAIVQCVANGNRSVKSVMGATRAGTGCGSCKSLVKELVEWACMGQVEEDPAAHYYVPGVALSKPDLVSAIHAQNLRSVSAVFDALADGRDDPASKPGLASLLRTIWREAYDDERDARFVNDRVHANIQNDGTFSVVPRIYGGVTSPDELRRIADVADKYQARMVKITGGQRIDLLGLKKSDLPDVWRDLGMPSGHAYTKAFRTCKTCVGTDFCRYAVGDSTALGIAIEKRFQGIESPGKMKLGASGCPRNCAEATVKDLGVVAVENGWQIYVGGAAGAHVRAGELLATVTTHEEVLNLMGRFMQYYRENARYAERTYTFLERLGIERLRAILVDDCEGDSDRLDREMAATVAAYRDPWQEGARPAEPNQFGDALPIATPAIAPAAS
ncbi:MAG TPA: nitrite reductase large subunit NirB [Candidatus Binataceae bacterium]|nr:nitrite reductase large subunit NirB [Candidatus Binataceae bacterium]